MAQNSSKVRKICDSSMQHKIKVIEFIITHAVSFTRSITGPSQKKRVIYLTVEGISDLYISESEKGLKTGSLKYIQSRTQQSMTKRIGLLGRGMFQSASRMLMSSRRIIIVQYSSTS